MSENQPQIDFWNGDAGKLWATNHAILDGNMAQLSEAALAFANAKAGEHALDVGCGTGDATVALARVLTQDRAPGRMMGVDISAPMLARARERAKEHGLGEQQITFVEADASEHAFAPRSFDLVFSRFGVMFFADPVKAFKNIRAATRGRLAFLCWRKPEENAWASAPMQVGRKFLPPQQPTPPDAPGPFSFASEARVKSVLAEAGWRDISVTAVDRPMKLGTTIDEASEFAMTMGPLSRALREANDPAINAKVKAELPAVLAPFEKNGVVAPPGACWLVGANS